MKHLLTFLLITLCVIWAACSKKTPATTTSGSSTDTAITSGQGLLCAAQLFDVENILIFPADNPWNQDISLAPVDPYNNQILAPYSSAGIFANFGSGLYQGAPIGIPFIVVCGNQPKMPVIFRANSYDGDYGDQSDPGPYPIPLDAPIENNGQGDAHVIAIDKDNDILYELYNASVSGNSWQASSGAIFDLDSDSLRPDGWTSADAAGLPIFPGLIRYDEVAKGIIGHAIRFTLTKANVQPAHISPARHDVSSTGGQYSLPFGARIRLKANFDISSFSATNQTILKAMKKYGLILADIGSNMFVTGTPDSRWNNDDLKNLGQVKAADFEVVKFNP